MLTIKDQRFAGHQRGLPVELVGSAFSTVAVTGETAALYYWNSGVRTADAGQAAGTLVETKLANLGITNAAGTLLGTFSDKSISFTSTAFTSEIAIPYNVLEDADTLSGLARITAINAFVNAGAGFTNGQYVIDYRKGTIYGKKATTQTSLTSVAYSYQSQSSAISSIVPGTGATNLGKAEDAAHASGDVGIEILAKRTDSPASSAGSDGDYATVNQDANGNQWSTLGSLISGEDQTYQVMKTQTQMTYTNISASALIKSGAGQFGGIVVNSCGAGATIKVWDQTSAAVPVMYNTVTFTAAEAQGTALMTPPPGTVTKFGTGLYVTISGTMDATVSWN